MTEGVKMPTNGWDDSKGILRPSETSGHLIDDIFIIRSGFIMHAPPSIDNFQLSILNMLLNEIPLCGVGIIPPPVKESHLNNREFVCGIERQFSHNRVDNVLNPCFLGDLIPSIEVVVDCFQPSNIIVGVWNQIDSYRSV